MARSWYQFNGGVENIVGHYSTLSFSLDLCVGGNNLCAIYAIYGGPNPASISTRLASYFTPAKATQSAFGFPTMGQPYVYTKP